MTRAPLPLPVGRASWFHSGPRNSSSLRWLQDLSSPFAKWAVLGARCCGGLKDKGGFTLPAAAHPIRSDKRPALLSSPGSR